MSKHSILARAVFQTRYHLHRRFLSPEQPGVSVLLVTWNRAEYLNLALRALAETVPDEHEVLLWNNASRDHTPDVIARWQDSRLRLRVFHSRTNIGTSGYAALALHAKRALLMGLDEDVVLLPQGWYEKVMEALRVFPELGYLALDVVQDEYTTGAKPLPEHYAPETRHGITVEFGPTGAWAAFAPRAFYFRTGGFPFRPHKPGFLQDAYYRREVEQGGRRWGILKGVYVYHAAGALWNEAMGYGDLMRAKSSAHGAPTASQLKYPPVGEKLPDRSVIERYRRELFQHES